MRRLGAWLRAASFRRLPDSLGLRVPLGLTLASPGRLDTIHSLPLAPSLSPPPEKGKNLAPPPRPSAQGLPLLQLLTTSLGVEEGARPRTPGLSQSRPFLGPELLHGALSSHPGPAASPRLSPSLQIGSQRRQTGPEASLGALTLTAEEAQA